MAQLLYTNQYFTTTLNVGGGIDASQTTGIIISDVSGIDTTKPGIALINYSDPLNTTTCEWVEYTSIDGSKELQGVTRGSEGFSAKTHNNGVSVAFPLSESHINRIAEKLNGNDTIDSDLDLAAGVNIKTAGADPYRTIVLPAGSWSATTTAGCGSATVEAGTNDVDYKVLDFDKDTDESAFAIFAMPDSWDGGTITFQPIWTTAGTTGTVVFSLAGRSFANDDAIDQAYGTAQTSTDTFIAAGDVHIAPTSSAITLAGTPAGGQLVQLKITRDVSEDTLDADARLIAIKLEYKVAQYSD
jgi:hypothetical protein